MLDVHADGKDVSKAGQSNCVSFLSTQKSIIYFKNWTCAAMGSSFHKTDL